MSSQYSPCEMGLFDFFRRASSRSRSKTTEENASATASIVSDVSMASAESRHSLPNGVKETATSLDSVATTASVESNNDSEVGDAPAQTESLGSIQNYEIVRELGRGATAVVQLGKMKDGEELVALKVFKTSLLKKMREIKRVGRRMVVSTALDKVQIEIAIMKKLKHRNLLNLLEVFDDDSETLVLMLEYAPHGQIMQWDANEKVYRANPKAVGTDNTSGVFDEESLRTCVRQLLLGLEYLHKNKICHRDLKPENILMGDDGVFKIADFGVAHFFEEEDKEEQGDNNNNDNNSETAVTDAATAAKKKGIVSSTAGTYAFMGPETLKGKEYSAYDADMWALGITVYALAFGKIPYYHPDVVELFEMIENQPLDFGDDNNNESSVSESLSELLRGMLEKNPEQRWSIQQCKEHPWVLEGLDDDAKSAFLDIKHEEVTVSQDEVAAAVTRVTSFNVLMRVQLGANKWKRKAMKSLEMKKRASLAVATIDEDGSERLSVTSSYSERTSFALMAATEEKPTASNNQMEL